MLERILAGGESGAEKAARQAAIAHGIPTARIASMDTPGERSPRPRLAQPEAAAELPHENQAAAAEMNARDSDATLWFGDTTTALAQATVGALRAARETVLAGLPRRGIRAFARCNLDHRKPGPYALRHW